MPVAWPRPLTAARIGVALGCSAQAARQRLGNVPPSGAVTINGMVANVWTFRALPASLRMELEERAKARGYTSAEVLLQEPAPRWNPLDHLGHPLPWAEIAPRWQDKALKTQQALLPALRRLDADRTLLVSEVIPQAVQGYHQVFGYQISPEHVRRLLNRCLERGADAREWHRMELFLDAQIGRAGEPPTVVASAYAQHRELDETIQHLENRATPTPDDRAYLFDAVFRHYKELLAQRPESAAHRAVKNSLIDYLFASVPALAKNAKTLRRLFEMKLRAWEAAGQTPMALQDQRRLCSGNFRRPDFTADEQLIRNLAIGFGGSESRAHREARQRGMLSQNFQDYYPLDARKNKSYVPGSVRQNITPAVEMTLPLHRGPWQAKMAGPYIPRDWSGVEPGDWFSADDVTWNHYFWFNDEAGRPQVARGECLVMMDLRSDYPLHFVLILGHYNSEHIRSLALAVHDKAGLPRKGFYLERSVWAARLIDGQRRAGADALHWRETELGLRERGLGLELKHATTPRAKPIEGAFRILQERMRLEPGFVGFNERTEDMERMQDFLARVRAGKEHPASELLSADQWSKRIDVILEEFAREPENGKKLGGRSPADAWQESMAASPLVRLPDDCRYLLATHKQIVRVRQEGIVLTIRGKKHLYAGEHTGELIGREVLAFYNIEQPSLLTVSEMNRTKYFTVKEIGPLPAMTATREQFEEVNARISSHMQPARVIHSQLRPHALLTITRDNAHDEATKELGRFHNQAVEENKAEAESSGRKLRQLRKEAASVGAALPADVRNPDLALAAVQREEELRQRIAERERAAARAENSPTP